MRRTLLVAAVLGTIGSALFAHELFIKLERYFVEPGAALRIPVLNGTFTASENGIARSRVRDLSVVGPAGRLFLDTAAWHPESTVTVLAVDVGDAGTYVVGASLRPSVISLTAAQFNEYLEHDGIPDILALRRERGELERPARERYHKHVKAVFQAGDRRTESFATVLGYPAELVPLANPYGLAVGADLRVRALVDGKPAHNQLIHWGGETAAGPVRERSGRTDHDGVIRIRVDRAGLWYVRFIHMVPIAGGDVDYESKWATLTFAVR